jgi:hypothetical protein
MNRLPPVFAAVACSLCLTSAGAYAGPCTEDIAQFEDLVRQAANAKSDAGPMGRQSVDSQLHHQPTPASIAHGEEEANAIFKAALTRAKKLDSERSAECANALAEAKRLFKF